MEIEIEDNGCGISAEHLEKVFDPFFTTKEPGRGTGLGLAVCLGLVESMGGSMNLVSEEGRGTTALLRLPVTRQTYNGKMTILFLVPRLRLGTETPEALPPRITDIFEAEPNSAFPGGAWEKFDRHGETVAKLFFVSRKSIGIEYR